MCEESDIIWLSHEQNFHFAEKMQPQLVGQLIFSLAKKRQKNKQKTKSIEIKKIKKKCRKRKHFKTPNVFSTCELSLWFSFLATQKSFHSRFVEMDESLKGFKYDYSLSISMTIRFVSFRLRNKPKKKQIKNQWNRRVNRVVSKITSRFHRWADVFRSVKVKKKKNRKEQFFVYSFSLLNERAIARAHQSIKHHIERKEKIKIHFVNWKQWHIWFFSSLVSFALASVQFIVWKRSDENLLASFHVAFLTLFFFIFSFRLFKLHRFYYKIQFRSRQMTASTSVSTMATELNVQRDSENSKANERTSYTVCSLTTPMLFQLNDHRCLPIA